MSFTHRARRGIIGTVAAALAAAGTIATAAPSQAAETSVTGVQFRWGFNDESGNRGAAPGTFNLFSAGRLGNPGAGSQTLSSSTSGATWSNDAAAGWAATAGNVRIEKKQSDGTFATATWAGTKTDKNGVSLGPYATSTTFSEHEVVIDGGSGTIDAAADDATIQWDGDFTVVYYSGYTFFYVSDPKLTVDNGVGTVTGTLGGYAADQLEPDKWEALPDAPDTVLATIKGVDVTTDGIVVTPEYAGVTYTGTSSTVPQVTTGAHAGSFPQAFVDFQQKTGAGPYWYSTGGSIDKNKHARPVTIDFTPATPVDPPVAPPVVAPPVAPPAPAPAVVKAATAKPVVKVSKKPTSKKKGKATVAVTSANGARPSGKVTITLSKGSSRKKVTAGLKNGKATVTLPKLKKGSWKLKAVYAGSATQRPSTSKTYTVKATA